MLCPHAGYLYAGPVAAHAYHALAGAGRPDCAIIIGPNHRGWGAPVAVPPHESWQTPLGAVDISQKLGRRLVEASGVFQVDELPFRAEHAQEMQLPFLQYLFATGVDCLPIALATAASYREVGRAVAEACQGEHAIIIATSSLSRGLGAEEARGRDAALLPPIEALDVEAFFEAIRRHAVSPCGAGPLAAAMVAWRALGSGRARPLTYATSGDVSGDRSSVVGYASFVVER